MANEDDSDDEQDEFTEEEFKAIVDGFDEESIKKARAEGLRKAKLRRIEAETRRNQRFLDAGLPESESQALLDLEHLTKESISYASREGQNLDTEYAWHDFAYDDRDGQLTNLVELAHTPIASITR